MMMRQSSMAVIQSERKRQRYILFYSMARKTNKLTRHSRISVFITMLNQYSFFWTALLRLNTLSFRVFSFIYTPASFQQFILRDYLGTILKGCSTNIDYWLLSYHSRAQRVMEGTETTGTTSFGATYLYLVSLLSQGSMRPLVLFRLFSGRLNSKDSYRSSRINNIINPIYFSLTGYFYFPFPDRQAWVTIHRRSIRFAMILSIYLNPIYNQITEGVVHVIKERQVFMVCRK